MEIKIQLEDPALCEGCPFSNDMMKCKAGFTRTTAKLHEVTRHAMNMWLSDYEQTSVKATPIRPRECVVATERAAEVIKKITEKKQKKSGLHHEMEAQMLKQINKFKEGGAL